MFAGLVSALALLFAQAPTDPAPLVSLDMPPDGGFGREGCLPIWVRLDKDGAISLSKGGYSSKGVRIERKKLGAALVALHAEPDSCWRVAVAGEYDTPYSDVLSVISLINSNGLEGIALISPPDEE